MIYLDNSATTPPDPDVIQVMTKVMKQAYGNPASLHSVGVEAHQVMEQARRVIARHLRCAPSEVLFTSGGTEANNMAIKGTAHVPGKHLITTQVEHDSVYEVYRQMEKYGYEVTYLPVDTLGRVSPQDIEEAITEETVLVSVIHVSNEVGTIQPIGEIGRRLCKYPKVTFHVDAVQSFGRLSIFPQEHHIDLLSFSAHKIHGPKGVGGLYKRDRCSLSPIFLGGGQEGKVRPGTPNVPGIAGMAKAVMLSEERRDDFMARTARWKRRMIDEWTSFFGDSGVFKVNGDTSKGGGVPYILHVTFPGLRSEVLLRALEDKGIYVSSQAACSSKKTTFRILQAMGFREGEATGAIRISMGFQTKESDILRMIDAVQEVVTTYRQMMGG